MSAQKSHCYVNGQKADSAGHQWYNHCLTVEGGILPSLATVKLRRRCGKEKIYI